MERGLFATEVLSDERFHEVNFNVQVFPAQCSLFFSKNRKARPVCPLDPTVRSALQSVFQPTVELGSGASKPAVTRRVTSVISCSDSAISNESAVGTAGGLLSASAFSIVSLRRYSSAIGNGY